MATSRRYLLVLAAFCAGLGLSGCANGNFELDPAYWFPDGKKKLPGERRELFPGGVPGVTQGIPPELIRGSSAQQPEEQALAPVQDAPPPQAEVEERPKPRPKRVARPRPAPEAEAVQTTPTPAEASRPAEAPRPAQPAAPGAWPTPQAQQQQQPAAPAASAWPSPPAPGTFTR